MNQKFYACVIWCKTPYGVRAMLDPWSNPEKKNVNLSAQELCKKREDFLRNMFKKPSFDWQEGGLPGPPIEVTACLLEHI